MGEGGEQQVTGGGSKWGGVLADPPTCMVLAKTLV